MNPTNKFRVIGIKLMQAKNDEEYLKVSLESMRDGIKTSSDCFVEVMFLKEAQADKWRAKCTEWDLATTEAAKDAIVPPIEGAVVIVPMEPYYTKLGQQGTANRPWNTIPNLSMRVFVLADKGEYLQDPVKKANDIVSTSEDMKWASGIERPKVALAPESIEALAETPVETPAPVEAPAVVETQPAPPAPIPA